MQIEQLTSDVHRLFQSILDELGESFSRDLLLAEVRYRRKKRLKVRQVILPPGTTAACLAFRDVDLIAVRTGLQPFRSLFSELHECGHLLLGSVPVCHMTYEEFRQNPNLRGAIYREFGTAYDRPEEGAVELLATLLIERIMRYDEMKRKNATPQHLLDLYA